MVFWNQWRQDPIIMFLQRRSWNHDKFNFSSPGKIPLNNIFSKIERTSPSLNEKKESLTNSFKQIRLQVPFYSAIPTPTQAYKKRSAPSFYEEPLLFFRQTILSTGGIPRRQRRAATPFSFRYRLSAGISIRRKWNTDAASRIVAPAFTAARKSSIFPAPPEATICARHAPAIARITGRS